jgi:hypothetical protein
MAERKYYPPDEDEDDEECRHGYPKHEWCPVCSRESEDCDKYHALKDDGLLDE